MFRTCLGKKIHVKSLTLLSVQILESMNRFERGLGKRRRRSAPRKYFFLLTFLRLATARLFSFI